MGVTAYIAVGANLGDRHANISRAIENLRQTPGIQITKVSSLIENPAIGGPADSPPFLNGAIEIETSLGARELLVQLLTIEKKMGRVRREKWGPRSIDLDVLLYGNQVIESKVLTVPHPLMHERKFVLNPLAEIAPDAIHPRFQKSIARLLAELNNLPEDKHQAWQNN